MKLALATAHQILVELSAQEQQQYGLLAEDAEAGDLRRTLQRILAGVAAVSGRRFRLQRRVRAELLPDRAGGCMLMIAGLEEQPAAERCCFFAETENDLIDAARAACAEAKAEISVTLLRDAAGYYLLTDPLPESLIRLLSEFMRFSTPDAAAEAVLSERCVPLLRQKPLSVLCGGA